MTSFMSLDGVTSFLRLKDVTISCKRMRRSLIIGGSSSVQWWKLGRSWRLRMCFRRLLCVRIEIDQLNCVNCWVIIHCLSVSCTKINHSGCALVIWSSLQLTSKQWIITQQITAGADLFLKQVVQLHVLQVLINKTFQRKIVNIFLPIIFSICFGCSKELSHWGSSFEYPKHMFWLRNKKIIFVLHTLD